MNKVSKNILKISVSLALGLFIFWWAYRRLDTSQIYKILSGNVHYIFIWVSVLLGIVANFFRGLRWKMLIDSLGEQKTSVINAFFAVLAGYFINFLFPRAGEIVRCGIITRYDKIGFTKIIGTMLAERAFDVIVLISLVVFAVILETDMIEDLLEKYVHFGSLYHTFFWLGIFLLISVSLFFVLKNRIKNYRLYKQIQAFVIDILQGIKTSLRLKRRGLFLFYTCCIWLCYFLMLYIPIFAFDFTSQLSVASGVFIFVMGSLGTIVPVQGGIGSWHLMTIISMGMCGIGEVEAGAFALIVHGAQMFSYMIGGILAFVGLQVVNKKQDSINLNIIK